jgi:hypothetical protein
MADGQREVWVTSLDKNGLPCKRRQRVVFAEGTLVGEAEPLAETWSPQALAMVREGRVPVCED